MIFKINDHCFKSDSKEIVRLSNGIPVDEIDPAKGITPTEAIALRFLGTSDDGKPTLAYTYIKVDPGHLSPADSGPFHIMDFLHEVNQVRGVRSAPHFDFVGRV